VRVGCPREAPADRVVRTAPGARYRGGMLLLMMLLACGETPSAHSRSSLQFAVPVLEGWTMKSADFSSGALLPAKHVCDAKDQGSGVSPDLSWAPPPAGTAALALVVTDPKSRRGEWVHWLVFDMPPTTVALPSGIKDVGTDGISDENWLGWSGPCPQRGTGAHQVVFDLIALDAPSGLGVASSLSMLAPHLRDHTIARTRLVAKTERVED
jgi:Raf kinase inhibitor-like YbhB/YbcL family protein